MSLVSVLIPPDEVSKFDLFCTVFQKQFFVTGKVSGVCAVMLLPSKYLLFLV